MPKATKGAKEAAVQVLPTVAQKFSSKITPQMRQAFLFKFQGLENEKIAENLNRKKPTIDGWFSNPFVTKEYEVFVEKKLATMDRRLTELAFKVTQKLEELLEDDDATVSLRAIDIYNKMTGRYKYRAQLDVRSGQYGDWAKELSDGELKQEKDKAKTLLKGLEHEYYPELEGGGDGELVAHEA